MNPAKWRVVKTGWHGWAVYRPLREAPEAVFPTQTEAFAWARKIVAATYEATRELLHRTGTFGDWQNARNESDHLIDAMTNLPCCCAAAEDDDA